MATSLIGLRKLAKGLEPNFSSSDGQVKLTKIEEFCYEDERDCEVSTVI